MTSLITLLWAMIVMMWCWSGPGSGESGGTARVEAGAGAGTHPLLTTVTVRPPATTQGWVEIWRIVQASIKHYTASANLKYFTIILEPYKIDILIYPLALLKISGKARLDWSLKFKGLIKFKVSGFEADHQFILKIKKRENHCISAAPRKLLKSILTFR